MKKRKISNHNSAYLNSFIYHLEVEKGLSDNSVESYTHDIKEFLNFHNTKVETICRKNIIDFFVFLQEIGLANSSVARKNSVIKSFFKFLEEEGIDLK